MDTAQADGFVEFIRGMRMTSLVIDSCQAAVKDRKRLEQNADCALEYGYIPELVEAGDKRAVIRVLHGVRLLAEPEDEADELGVLSVEYRVVYETPGKITPDIFDEFKSLSLLLHTTPFAREWLHQQSLQMGIQPILLPLALTHPIAAGPILESAERRTRPAKKKLK